MSTSDDDEDVKQAIALSLQPNESKLNAKDRLVINIEDEDEPPKQCANATAALPNLQPISDQNHQTRGPPGINVPTSTYKGAGLLGLDRKKMEQERLARKRKPSISPPPSRKTSKLALTQQPQSLSAASQPGAGLTYPLTQQPQSLSAASQPGAGFTYPRGVVKKTWAFGYTRAGNDIKLEEVLQKNDLQLAVMSSFQWDIPWLLAKINSSTLITLVMQAKEEATKVQYRRETADMANLRLCFPSMDGQINCMHSKLMLLSHPTYLRVVVPTANLVRYDWGEDGTMENMVFLIDLPRLKDGKRATKEEMTFFQELLYFLEAMGLEQSIIDSLYKFDFSGTEGLAFVHTIGGPHFGTGDPWRRTGYCGLGRAIKELGLVAIGPITLDFVTSSVGSLNTDFLATLYLACKGDDGTAEYNDRNPPPKSKSRDVHGTASKGSLTKEMEDSFHVYFPTRETVKSSRVGSAGTICFQSKWYDSPTFPRQVLRDCKSVRVGMLMHNKLILVRPKSSTTAATSTASSPGKAWAYIGSANCSESAWGKLTKDRTTKMPKLNCRNWECGVVVPTSHRLEDSPSANGVDGKAIKGLAEEFAGVVPVPMQVPGAEYGKRRPWFYAEG